MRALMMIAALAFAAPASAEPPSIAPAPTPSEITVRVSADQNGETITAPQGESIAIELQSSPSSGSGWRITAHPDFLGEARIVQTSTAAPNPQGGMPRIGAPRWQVFVLPVTAAGSGELVLEKRGPGAQGVLLETFRVTINAE